MTFLDLAELVNRTAQEQADRDAQTRAILTQKLDDISEKVVEVARVQSLHDHRLTTIEGRCVESQKRHEADTTSQIQALQESGRHWRRYAVSILVGLFLLVLGGFVTFQFTRLAQARQHIEATP